MGRPAAADPRSETLLLRLTRQQMDRLEAAAYVTRQTANSYAYHLVVAHLAVLSNDAAVQLAEAARNTHDARDAAEGTRLADRRRDLETRTQPSGVENRAQHPHTPGS